MRDALEYRVRFFARSRVAQRTVLMAVVLFAPALGCSRPTAGPTADSQVASVPTDSPSGEATRPAEPPASEQPTAEQPASEPRTAEQPTAEPPASEQPGAEQPTAEPPASAQPPAEGTASDVRLSGEPLDEPPGANLGQQLFARHCAGCHGQDGTGVGLAEPYLFPKPRDLRNGAYRLVSTENRMPSRADLDAVLTRGMPGSAMPAWPQLSDEQRQALIDEIFHIRRLGARERYIRILKEEEELSDEEIADPDVQQEIDEYVERFTTPGPVTRVPPIQPPTAEAIAHGREVYIKAGCVQCHGAEGRGDGVQAMKDDRGLPTRPRDFTRGIFKGGHDPQSLYRRTAYGMPGTPMPSADTLMPEQIVDLVHFIRSLSDEPLRQAAVLTREQIHVTRVDRLPESSDPSLWSSVPIANVRLTPLWWRDDFFPAHDTIEVQAVHDGHRIAVRLSWPDETANDHALTSSSFEDGIAMQLFQGAEEPFLGMGGFGGNVDIWYWDADRQAAKDVLHDQYPRSAVDIYPLSEPQVDTAELDRPGSQPEAQPAESLPAVAAGNQIVPDGQRHASGLAAAGPGSLTFRLPKSQIVQAHGEYQDGRWTVQMVRDLVPPTGDDAVALTGGQPTSVAFAVWDGAHHDRDGQKLISIWQELRLQP